MASTLERATSVPTRCFHCGEANPSRSNWRADIDGRSERFCCAGCLAVAQTIRAAGLSTFYALREEAEPQARNEAPTVSDVPRAHVADVARDIGNGLREMSLLLDGIHCGACVWLIETWLMQQPGIREASVNFATRRARVRFAAADTSPASILRDIGRIGYRAHPYDPGRREALARRESRALLLRMALALLGMMQVMMFAVPAYISVDGVDAEYQALMNWASLVVTLPVVLYSGAPFFTGAWRGLRVRRPGMDVPIALGVSGAFVWSAWTTIVGRGAVYFDSVTMFIALVLVARFVELQVRAKAGDALESIAREMPPSAHVLEGYPQTASERIVTATELRVGDCIRVESGAPLPADGVVVEGRSSVEEAVLTGESWPRAKTKGDRVMAGSVNRESPLVVRVTAVGEATTLAGLARLVERAASERPRIARLADRVATRFVAILLALTAAVAVAWWFIDPARALPVALSVLVVSCPCALSLATPAALASAAGALGRRQILCVRPDALEAMSRVTHVVLDKTGTLTTGNIRVAGVTAAVPEDASRCLHLAATLEQGSAHPMARALREFKVDPLAASHLTAVAGSGVEGLIQGTRYRFGRADWVAERCRATLPASFVDVASGESPALLASENEWLACIRFGDRVRPEAVALVRTLRGLGLHPSIISGDGEATVASVAHAVGIDEWHADARPVDKRRLIADLQRRGAVVAMIGDGINDAPSLAQADVALTLGSAATLTQWTADAVVLGDDLSRIGHALVAARRTFRVIRQNVAWALVYNIVAIPLAATGHLSPLAAAIGMSASSLIVVGNAWRLSRLSGAHKAARAQTRFSDRPSKRSTPDAAPGRPAVVTRADAAARS